MNRTGYAIGCWVLALGAWFSSPADAVELRWRACRSGRERALIVALDQIFELDAAGRRSLVAISPQSDVKALRQYMINWERASGGRVFFVVYAPRADRGRARWLLTPRVIVKLARGVSVADVANELGVTVRRLRRGRYEFATSRSADAYELIERLQRHPKVLCVEPILARCLVRGIRTGPFPGFRSIHQIEYEEHQQKASGVEIINPPFSGADGT